MGIDSCTYCTAGRRHDDGDGEVQQVRRTDHLLRCTKMPRGFPYHNELRVWVCPNISTLIAERSETSNGAVAVRRDHSQAYLPQPGAREETQVLNAGPGQGGR